MVPKVNIPKDTRAQKELLKDLLSGKKTVGDLVEDTLTINLNLHPTDEDRIKFNEAQIKQDSFMGDGNITHFTITLNP